MTALRYQITKYIEANLSPAARSKRFAQAARQARDDLIRSGKASTTYETIVDGQPGVSEDQVKGTGGGTILYAFSYGAEATVFGLTFLRTRTQSLGSDYGHSFWVSVNSRYIAPGRFDPSLVPPDAEIIIGNTEPFNRLVDVQLRGGRRVRFTLAPRIYDDAARAIRRQFRGVIDAKRIASVEFPGQYQLKGNRGPVQSPALVINRKE